MIIQFTILLPFLAKYSCLKASVRLKASPKSSLSKSYFSAPVSFHSGDFQPGDLFFHSGDLFFHSGDLFFHSGDLLFRYRFSTQFQLGPALTCPVLSNQEYPNY